MFKKYENRKNKIVKRGRYYQKREKKKELKMLEKLIRKYFR